MLRTYYPISITLLIACALLTLELRSKLEHFKPASSGVAEAPLYLPSSSHVRLMTLGFDNMAADVAWFQTVNYFGKELERNRDYRWLYEMCDLITTLDPRPEHYYEFCGTLLSWIAKNVEESNKILSKGIEANPHLWRPRYLRGFNYWYFLERNDLAREDLHQASIIPNAPTFLASQASRLMVQQNDVDNAITFLKDLIQNSKSDSAKRALGDKLKRAYLAKTLRVLTEGIQRYRDRYGRAPERLEELVEGRILRGIPDDDGFGGRFIYDAEKDEVKNTSGERALEFNAMTAKTGAFRAFEEQSR